MVFPSPTLVRENAATFTDPGEREDDGVDLVRVGIDSGRALRSDGAPVLVRPAQSNQIFRGEAALERVRRDGRHAARTLAAAVERGARKYLRNQNGQRGLSGP
jgi:hypothetical protein